MTGDPARDPAWTDYRRRLQSIFAAAGGGTTARAAVVAAVVQRVQPEVSVRAFGDIAAVAVPSPPAELVTPELPGLVLEHLLGPDGRRGSGVHHTPAPIAAALIHIALDGRAGASEAPPAPLTTTVCDPAVGGGVFLLAAARVLRQRGADVSTVLDSLYGADLDPLAVATSQAALACWAVGEGAGPDQSSSVGRLVVSDGLDLERSSWPAAPAGGFDVVVGNPPFLNQLERATARLPADRERLRERFGDQAGGYADTAGLFLVAALALARTGGRVAMIQPESLLAARDASGVRKAVEAAGGLTDLWVAAEPVFAAGVRVCAPALTVGVRSTSVNRFRGAGFTALAPADLSLHPPAGNGDSSREGATTWSTLALAAYGTPTVALPTDAGTVADLATATAGFRDQFYGLAPHVVEGGSEEVDGQVPLVTVGSIDPLSCHWGTRPVRFAGRRWTRPLVDLDSLREDPALHRWVTDRLVPKVLVATQTRVVEAVVDGDGRFVPSVPVIAVSGAPEDLWALAAVLLSPPVSAWALGRAAGTALTSDAVKLSARQVLAVPLPPDQERWRATARDLAEGLEGGPLRFGAAMCAAYGLDSADPVLPWWRDRLRTWRGQPVDAESPAQ